MQVLSKAQAEIKGRLGGNPNVTIHSYPGMDHAFARQGGEHYDAAAAKLANELKKGPALGFTGVGGEVDFPAVMQRIQRVCRLYEFKRLGRRREPDAVWSNGSGES